MLELGIEVGETISLYKIALNPEQQAVLKLISGKIKKTVSHGHLHTQTQAVGMGTVMAEGQRLNEAVGKVGRNVDDISDRLRGKASQSDKERLKEINLARQSLANEAGDLRETISKANLRKNSTQ